MSDPAFVLIMAAIVAFPIALTAYVRRSDARHMEKLRREFLSRRRCLRWDCLNRATDGRAFCRECIEEMEGARK